MTIMITNHQIVRNVTIMTVVFAVVQTVSSQVLVEQQDVTNGSTSSSSSSSSNILENTMNTCLTVSEAYITILLCGILLFIIVLYNGTKYHGKPLQYLGKRPLGYGLWEWLYNCYCNTSPTAMNVSRRCVSGYDPIVGSFHPIWRLCIHIGTIFIVWGCTCYCYYNYIYYLLFPVFQSNTNVWNTSCGIILNTNTPPIPTIVLYIGILICSTYIVVFYYLYHINTNGTSYPGKPRKSKITRYPQWYNRYISFPTTSTNSNTNSNSTTSTTTSNTTTNHWTYVQSDLSHKVSEYIFRGTAGCITGETSGRDIWTSIDTTQIVSESSATTGSTPTKTKSKSKTTTVDEKLVQLLASGGRLYNDDSNINTTSTSTSTSTKKQSNTSTSIGFNPSINPNSADIVVREQLIRQYLEQYGTSKKDIATNVPNVQTIPTSIKESIYKGIQYYTMLLTNDGHWTGDYGGPHFLLPGLIIIWYIIGQPISVFTHSDIQLIIHYMKVHQQIDGGWGTHIESPSTMFGTVLQYVALRLLGIDCNDPICVIARQFIHTNGGALLTSSWAKFYLCLLGVMDWQGHNSVPAELWLLPNWFPFHPCRMWCHSRMVYLPMGYLYGVRYVYPNAENDSIIQQLRNEIYLPNQDYSTIDWNNTRHLVASIDNYSPIPFIMKWLHNILAIYENWTIIQPFKNYIRQKGLNFSIQYIAAEDLQTNYICIGPVNKVLNLLCQYHNCNNDISHPIVINHLMRIADYMWVAEDGMKMKGYNGSQCWDTSFAIQAIAEAKMLDDFPIVATNVWNYLERTQILSTSVSQSTVAYQYENELFRKLYYRHVSQGGWPFSTSAHGWPISDCSGEGLKSILCLLQCTTIQKGFLNNTVNVIDDNRLLQCINVLLSYQNEDGGFATYENTRGFSWYEYLNPSEVFGDIMIDYSYVECTMASITALADYQHYFPNSIRQHEISIALQNGKRFITSIQRPDGSWYGNWACCFTYACWFGIEGLVKCSSNNNGDEIDTTTADSIERCCIFLISKQRVNGGWGEDFTSCFNKSYAINGMEAYGDPKDGSSVVNTSWALLALSAAHYTDNIYCIQRGIQYLIKRQLCTGDWPQEGIAGVFNRACGITYSNYRNIFPIWALARCRAVYGDDILTRQIDNNTTTSLSEIDNLDSDNNKKGN